MLSVKLVVVGGDAKSKEVQLKLPTVIGRGKEGVTLTLPHKLVSRKHTEIFEQQGQLFVRDMGSLNGTFVNNRRIAGPQPLQPNELLTLGNVTFRAIYDPGRGAEPVAADNPAADVSNNVLDDNSARLEVADEDTGKSFAELPAAQDESPAIHDDSHIFSGPEIASGTPDRSISVSAIDQLPAARTGDEPAFEVRLQGVSRPDSVKNIEIELDADRAAAQHDDSKLGSFLKKMPR